MNNERATPNYEFMTDSSQEIKFPFNNYFCINNILKMIDTAYLLIFV